MIKRILTALVGVPIVIFLLSLGGLWLRYALLVVSLIGLFEFYRALSKKVMIIHFSGYLFTILYYLFVIATGNHTLLMITIAAFIVVTQSLAVIFYQKIKINDCLITMGGFFYVTFLLSFTYFVREHSIYFVWLILISSSASDTFAYVVGQIFGKHKLVGTPSPGKTVEGCVGGVLGAALVGFLYGTFFNTFMDLGYSITVNATAICAVGAVFSQFGDMFASAIKRSVNIKDFGKLLPGHGGILDRLDSAIVTAPVVYIVMTLLT